MHKRLRAKQVHISFTLLRLAAKALKKAPDSAVGGWEKDSLQAVIPELG